MFFSSLEETSVAYVALAKWLPSIFTVLLGGYLASVLFPRLQKSYQKSLQEEERKRQIAEDVVQSFSRYVIAWRRLIQIAELEQEESQLTETQLSRKREFVEDRKEQRDILVDRLKLCSLYFSGVSCRKIEEFLEWDELQSSKTLEELPDISEWRKFECEMARCIKDELER